MQLLQMMWEFFKTGLFAVGGGLATLPFLQDIGLRTGWYSNEDLANMVAVSESTPGPIGVNMATYVGFHTAGILGGVLTTLALITPSIVVILLISRFLEHFKGNRMVDNVFYGLRPASTGLIAAACFGVMQIALFNQEAFAASGNLRDLIQPKALILAGVLLIVTHQKDLKDQHPIVFLASSAVVGIMFHLAA